MVEIPSFPIEAGDRDEIEAIAGATRREWELGLGPIESITMLLESKGCVVVRAPVDVEGVDAYSRWTAARPIIVLGRDKDDAARSNFDAAHELGHLVMHHDPAPGSRDAEAQAQAFAAAFLLPAQAIRDELPRRFDIRRYVQLKRRWRVSIQALAYRSRTLGLISEATFRRGMARISLRGWRTGEPYPIGPADEPVLLRAAVDLIGQARGTSIHDLASELGFPQDVVDLFLVDRDRPSVTLSRGPASAISTAT
jgi:Zn-dependent peptidase ImmA (M78 family)